MNDLLFSVFPSENFVDLSLFQSGREKCSPAHSFGPAARNHYLFHYVISGTGRMLAYDKNGDTKEYFIILRAEWSEKYCKSLSSQAYALVFSANFVTDCVKNVCRA